VQRGNAQGRGALKATQHIMKASHGFLLTALPYSDRPRSIKPGPPQYQKGT